MYLEMDEVTSAALANLERTDVGITIMSWINTLIEERKERLTRHRGLTSIPDMWHDQGFVDGCRAVAHIFEHAKNMDGRFEEEEETTQVEVPEPSYLGASSDQPRR